MAKSIIEVEVKDGAWKSFQAQVKEHQKILQKMPAQWGAAGQAIGKVTGAAAKMVASVKETANQFNKANTTIGKMVVALKTTDRLMTSVGRSTLNVARNLKEATRSLLSWSSILGVVSGVLGAGGLFGIARMASTVSMGQASAMRTGSTYGGTQAAQVAFQQLLGGPAGVQNLLELMAADKEKGGLMFKRLAPYGLKESDVEGKSSTDILAPFLKALQRAFKEAPGGMKAKALEPITSALDFNTIIQLSKTNIDQLEQFYEEQKKQLALSVDVQNRWSELNRVLDAAKEKLYNTFIIALTPLTPAIKEFSKSINKAIATLMGSGIVKKGIAGVGKGLESFAKYLGSDEFPKDLKAFIDELKKIGESIKDTAEFLHKIFGAGDEKSSKEAQSIESDRARLKKYQEERESLKPTAFMPHMTMRPQKFDFNIRLMNEAGDNKSAQTWATGAFGTVT